MKWIQGGKKSWNCREAWTPLIEDFHIAEKLTPIRPSDWIRIGNSTALWCELTVSHTPPARAACLPPSAQRVRASPFISRSVTALISSICSRTASLISSTAPNDAQIRPGLHIRAKWVTENVLISSCRDAAVRLESPDSQPEALENITCCTSSELLLLCADWYRWTFSFHGVWRLWDHALDVKGASAHASTCSMLNPLECTARSICCWFSPCEEANVERTRFSSLPGWESSALGQSTSPSLWRRYSWMNEWSV